MDNIQKRLKQLRTHLGLTQRQISAELGVKPSYYSDLENGHRTITGKFIKKLQNKYFVSADWLYTGIGGFNTLNSEQIMYPKNVPPTVPKFEVHSLDKENTELKYQSEEEKTRKLAKERIEKLRESMINSEPKIITRVLLDIKRNNIKINELSNDLNDLQLFEYIISNLNYYYFNSIDLQLNSVAKFFKNGKFNYEDYKAAYLAELEKLEKIRPALHKIAKAIKEFYKDIEDFDTENIVKSYFGKSIKETQ